MAFIVKERVNGEDMLLLSVVVPVYNTEKYLEKCLDSILKQTCKDLEIIIINDGSTDSSADILSEYEKKYPELRIIKQDNHGIGYTRNKGIELAKGKYVTFIDSDDSIEPEYCEKLCGKAEKHNLDMVICDYYEVDEVTKEKAKIELAEFDVSNLNEMPSLLFDINSSPWNKIYKTELLKQHDIRFPEKLKYEDVVFVLKFMGVADKIGKVKEPLVNYLIREGSETKVMNPRVFDIFEILEEINLYFSKSDKFNCIKEYLEWFCINRITVYCIQQKYQKDWDTARRFIEDGFEYLKKRFPEWRKNSLYINNNSCVKRILKSNKLVMKMFVKITGKL